MQTACYGDAWTACISMEDFVARDVMNDTEVNRLKKHYIPDYMIESNNKKCISQR